MASLWGNFFKTPLTELSGMSDEEKKKAISTPGEKQPGYTFISNLAKETIAAASPYGFKPTESSNLFGLAYGANRYEDYLKAAAVRKQRREGVEPRGLSTAARFGLALQRQKRVASTLLGGAAQEDPAKRTVLGSG